MSLAVLAAPASAAGPTVDRADVSLDATLDGDPVPVSTIAVTKEVGPRTATYLLEGNNLPRFEHDARSTTTCAYSGKGSKSARITVEHRAVYDGMPTISEQRKIGVQIEALHRAGRAERWATSLAFTHAYTTDDDLLLRFEPFVEVSGGDDTPVLAWRVTTSATLPHGTQLKETIRVACS